MNNKINNIYLKNGGQTSMVAQNQKFAKTHWIKGDVK